MKWTTVLNDDGANNDEDDEDNDKIVSKLSKNKDLYIYMWNPRSTVIRRQHCNWS